MNSKRIMRHFELCRSSICNSRPIKYFAIAMKFNETRKEPRPELFRTPLSFSLAHIKATQDGSSVACYGQGVNYTTQVL